MYQPITSIEDRTAKIYATIIRTINENYQRWNILKPIINQFEAEHGHIDEQSYFMLDVLYMRMKKALEENPLEIQQEQ